MNNLCHGSDKKPEFDHIRKKNNALFIGHILAILVMSVWGVTFIATKVLLRTFSSLEIILIRFLISYVTLLIIRPKRLKLESRKQEIPYMIAGIIGITLYYFLENTALTYTLASNVGVIVATAPFFTAIIAGLVFGEEEKPGWLFYLGCVLAFAGIIVISVNGAQLQMNPIGDLMTVGAAFSWAFYSIALKKINSYGYDTILNSRRIFFWGLVTTFPICMMEGIHFSIRDIMMPVNLILLLLLGVGAGAVCYVLWNYAADIVGPVRINVYIYLDPVVAVAASAILLHEPVTKKAVAGTILVLGGLVISEWKGGHSGEDGFSGEKDSFGKNNSLQEAVRFRDKKTLEESIFGKDINDGKRGNNPSDK